VMNRYGERGSPCLSPCLQFIQVPGTPFSRTAVLPVASSLCIQAQNLGRKPLC
jgi:hypothetical protein